MVEIIIGLRWIIKWVFIRTAFLLLTEHMILFTIFTNYPVFYWLSLVVPIFPFMACLFAISFFIGKDKQNILPVIYMVPPKKEQKKEGGEVAK